MGFEFSSLYTFKKNFHHWVKLFPESIFLKGDEMNVGQGELYEIFIILKRMRYYS